MAKKTTSKKSASKKTASRKTNNSAKAEVFANLPTPDERDVRFCFPVYTFGHELCQPGTVAYNPLNWRDVKASVTDLINKLLLEGWTPNLDTGTGVLEHPVAYEADSGELVLIQGHRRYRALCAIADAEKHSDATKLDKLYEGFRKAFGNPTDDDGNAIEPRRLFSDAGSDDFRSQDAGGILPDGGIIPLRVFGVELDATTQDLLINDEDEGQVIKTVFERFPAYLRWRLRGLSVLDACRRIGYTSRQMVYTWLEKLPLAAAALWLGVARRDENGKILHPFVTDPNHESLAGFPEIKGRLIDQPVFAIANPARTDSDAYRKAGKDGRIKRISDDAVQKMYQPEREAAKGNPAHAPGTSEGYTDAVDAILAGGLNANDDAAPFRTTKENRASLVKAAVATGDELLVRAVCLAYGMVPEFKDGADTLTIQKERPARNSDASAFRAECAVRASK